MQTLRQSVVPVYATALLAAAALAGCATNRLAMQPPPGVRLSGDWKVDPVRSDDLGKAVQQLQAQRAKVLRANAGRQQGFADLGGGQGGGPGGQQGGGTGPGESDTGPEVGQDVGAGPRSHGSPVAELMSSVPRGDYLRITFTAETFTVKSGDSSNDYTPGLVSEISAEQGDAQQMSGWNGPAFVIDTKPQLGPEITQTYSLTPDDRLAVSVRLSGGGIDLTFTRVYDRTTSVAPLAPPSIN